MKKNKIVNPSEIGQSNFSNRSSAQRGIDAGWNPKPIGLITTTSKRISAEKSRYVPVIFYNQTGSTVFVKFGDKDVVAPANASEGFPILAGEKCVLNSGENEFAVTSLLAGIYAYTCPDEED